MCGWLLTSVLSQTKSRILYVWQESHKDPQPVDSNYKEGKEFIAEGCIQSRNEVQEMYMALCAMYIILFHLYFIITPN
jgi:hypothetical protein